MAKRNKNKIVGYMHPDEYDNLINKTERWLYFSMDKDEMKNIQIVILRKADYDALIEEAARIIAQAKQSCLKCEFDNICPYLAPSKEVCFKFIKRHLRNITAKPKGKEKKR